MPPTIITDTHLMRLPRDGHKYELVDGEILVSPAGVRHGQIAVRLIARLGSFVETHGLGHVLESSTGFRLRGGNVRCPDVSFVARGRFADDAHVPDSFADLAPDLAVEILSPTDDARQVLDKVGEYLRVGVRLIWVVDPRTTRAAVYRSLTEVRELSADGTLDGEDVVPGFSVDLRTLLA